MEAELARAGVERRETRSARETPSQSMEELVYPRRLQLGCSAADGGALLALTLVVLRLRRRVR